MNLHEIQSLSHFLNQLVQARGIAKDPQADSMIEHMMHPGGAAGFMNPSGMASLSSPTGSSTVNNFYEADERMTSGSALDFLATDDPNLDDDSTLG